MHSHTKNLTIEQVSLGVVWLSEYAGISQLFGVPLAWIGVPFTSWGFMLPLIIQIPFFFLWCLVQAYVTLFLFIQVHYASLNKRNKEGKHARVFTNAVIVCTVIQIFGFLHSMQVFGASVALTDGIFLYLYQQNEPNRNVGRIITQALQARSKR